MREGICPACKEWTQVPGSCCSRPISSEGSLYSDDDFCNCVDCEFDDEKACEMDCKDDENACQGCREYLDAKKDELFDGQMAEGRK